MKNLVFFILICSFTAACVKEKPLTPNTVTEKEMEVIKKTEVAAVGTFMNGVHPTSGKVEIVFDKMDAKKKYLSFTGFKTDAGPDLRIYLAEDTKAKGFTEISKLTKTGDFLLEIPTEAMPENQKYVLIWCKQFSVLFGSAKLE